MTADTVAVPVPRRIPVGKVEVSFRDIGDGPAAILLHGAGPGTTGWDSFAPNIGALSQHYRVIVPDMPGWGASGRLCDATDPIDVLVGLMDDLGVERAAFVGNSMGATTSLRMAVYHPDRVSHLVTSGGVAPGVDIFGRGDGLTDGLQALIAAYREPTRENLGRLIMAMCFDPAMATEERISARAAAVHERPEHLTDFLAAGAPPGAADLQQLGSRLAAIKAPMLAFHGRNDRVLNYENSLRLLSLVPHARAYLVGKCGHWVQTEQPDEFNRIVLQFLQHSTTDPSTTMNERGSRP